MGQFITKLCGSQSANRATAEVNENTSLLPGENQTGNGRRDGTVGKQVTRPGGRGSGTGAAASALEGDGGAAAAAGAAGPAHSQQGGTVVRLVQAAREPATARLQDLNNPQCHTFVMDCLRVAGYVTKEQKEKWEKPSSSSQAVNKELFYHGEPKAVSKGDTISKGNIVLFHCGKRLQHSMISVGKGQVAGVRNQNVLILEKASNVNMGHAVVNFHNDLAWDRLEKEGLTISHVSPDQIDVP